MTRLVSEPLIPLVIGVTGHRDARAQDERLTAPLSEALERLQARLPNTPVIVLSSLAEGADRRLARLAVDRLDAELVVPLPLPAADYAADFVSVQSRKDFHSLLAAATAVRVVPSAPDADRPTAYAAAGAFIVEHSHVLIALWDGQPARGVGGTAHVVDWWRSGAVPHAVSGHRGSPRLLPVEARPIIWANPTTGGVRVEPDAREPATAWDALDRLDDLNADILARRLTAGGATASGALGSGAGVAKLVQARHQAVDAAAVELQREERRLTRLILGIFAVSVVLYGLMSWIALVVGFHVLSLPAIAALVMWMRKRRIEARALDYRAVAEGLRVLYYWRSAGLADRVSDSYLNRHAGVITWIRQAVAAVEALVGPGDVPAGAASDTARTWVSSQRTYFAARRAAAARDAARAARAVRWTGALTLVIALAYAAVVLTSLARGGPLMGAAAPVDIVFQSLLGLTGGLAVALEAYRRRYGFDTLNRQYALAERVFSAAERRLADGSWPVDEVLRALGREALAENAEWLWMRRAQPIDVPR